MVYGMYPTWTLTSFTWIIDNVKFIIHCSYNSYFNIDSIMISKAGKTFQHVYSILRKGLDLKTRPMEMYVWFFSDLHVVIYFKNPKLYMSCLCLFKFSI